MKNIFFSFKAMRKRATSKTWLTVRLRYWAEKEKELSNFKTFKCSTFFEGRTLAELNQVEYDERAKILYRKMGQIQRLLQTAK